MAANIYFISLCEIKYMYNFIIWHPIYNILYRLAYNIYWFSSYFLNIWVEIYFCTKCGTCEKTLQNQPKPPLLKQQSHILVEQEHANLHIDPWMKQCYLRGKKKRGREKSYNFTLAIQGSTNSYPISTKGKNDYLRKKGVPHRKQKIKQEKSGIRWYKLLLK